MLFRELQRSTPHRQRRGLRTHRASNGCCGCLPRESGGIWPLKRIVHPLDDSSVHSILDRPSLIASQCIFQLSIHKQLHVCTSTCVIGPCCEMSGWRWCVAMTSRGVERCYNGRCVLRLAMRKICFRMLL